MRPEAFAELLSTYNGPDVSLLDQLQVLQRHRLKLVSNVMRLRDAPFESRPRILLQILLDWLRLRGLNARLINHLVDHSEGLLQDRRAFYRSVARYSGISFDINSLSES